MKRRRTREEMDAMARALSCSTLRQCSDIQATDFTYKGPDLATLCSCWRYQLVAWESPIRVESVNYFIRAHYRRYQNHKDLVFKSLQDAMIGSTRSPTWKKEAIEHAVIAIISKRAREVDGDNFVAKPWIDALRRYGIILDDRMRNVWLQIRQDIEKPRFRKTIVAVYPAELVGKTFVLLENVRPNQSS